MNGYSDPRGTVQCLACSGVTDLVIPSNVTAVGDWAFFECVSLESVAIGQSVESIGEGAFYGCSSVTVVDIGACLEPGAVQSGVFEGATAVRSYTIADCVTASAEELQRVLGGIACTNFAKPGVQVCRLTHSKKAQSPTL